MNTLFALMAEYGTAEIPLEKVAQKFWALSPAKAKMAAAKQSLPVPAYRGPTQKCPWLIHAEDLAKWIDEQREKARRDHAKVNGLEHLLDEDEYNDAAPPMTRAG